jgi:hypothetical protein
VTVDSRIVSLFVIATVGACARVDQGPGAGTGGSGQVSSSGGNGGVVTGTGGTGNSTVTGTGGDMRGTVGTGGGGGEASCGLESFNLVRKPGDVVVVLDRSASMKKNSMDKDSTGPTDPTKWAQLIPALTDVIAMAGTEISWGLKNFPEDGSECSATTVTSKIDLPVSAMNSTALNAAIKATLPEGNGTPTGAAVAVAAAYLKGLNDGNKQYLLLATDGQPSCGGTAGALVKSTDQARTDSVAAVSTAAGMGIHTFVVGVATKSGDSDTLNMLATAGQEPRADPNPLATKYYLGTTNAELVTALKSITGVINRDCIFPLSKAPPVPENIAVKVMSVKAPYDTSNGNGWNYTDANHTAVQVYGSWCEMIKTSAANMVQIIFGCPNIPIP